MVALIVGLGFVGLVPGRRLALGVVASFRVWGRFDVVVSWGWYNILPWVGLASGWFALWIVLVLCVLGCGLGLVVLVASVLLLGY